MQFQVSIDIPAIGQKIQHKDPIYLIGSCFTENIAAYLKKAKFRVLSNAHGILFNPFSVQKSIQDIVNSKEYQPSDLFYLNEQWNSWYHHSDFSVVGNTSSESQACCDAINKTILQHHEYIKEAKHVIITLGSAFAYWHIENKHYVSNNHRAPSQWFRKDLLTIDAVTHYLQQIEADIRSLNPQAQILYTISPVRHLRDGVIENNRSKARLIEAVHGRSDTYYFPSYELVLDVLRDYRFYDLDMAHPNYAATAFVWEKFKDTCIDAASYEPMRLCEQVSTAMQHRPRHENTEAHKKFRQQHVELCLDLMKMYPYLNLEEEQAFFGS